MSPKLRNALRGAVIRFANGFYLTATAIAALMVGIAFFRFSVGWIDEDSTLIGVCIMAALIWFDGWACRKFLIS